jgi:hypothetical protein
MLSAIKRPDYGRRFALVSVTPDDEPRFAPSSIILHRWGGKKRKVAPNPRGRELQPSFGSFPIQAYSILLPLDGGTRCFNLRPLSTKPTGEEVGEKRSVKGPCIETRSIMKSTNVVQAGREEVKREGHYAYGMSVDGYNI